MYQFLYKLQVSGQLKFKEGHINVLGHPSLMLIPEEAFLSMQEEFLKTDPHKLYQIGKKAGEELSDLIKQHTRNKTVIFRFGIDLINLSGFGKLKTLDYHIDQGKAIIHIEDSLNSKLKTQGHTCHYMRGLLAGFMQEITNQKIECIESQCMATGNKTCEFIIQKQEEFDPENKIVQEQLILK